MKPRRSQKPKPVAAPREQPCRQLQAEMVLAQKVSSVEEIFCGDTTPDIRKTRIRKAIGSRKADFWQAFEAVYREPLE